MFNEYNNGSGRLVGSQRPIDMTGQSYITDKYSPNRIKDVPFPSKSGRGMFGSYDDFLTGNTKRLTYPILEGLYKNTKFYTVVDQIVGDMMSESFTIETDSDKGDDLCKDLIKKWGMNNIEESITDTFVYGNSFDFLQWSLNGQELLAIKEMTGENVLPQYRKDNYAIDSYLYYESEEVYYPEDILKLTFNKPKGEHFGFSLLSPAAATLMLLLNSSSNIAMLLDRYAQPIVHWLLDSGLTDADGDKVKVTEPDIVDFLETLSGQKLGEDFVTDASVEAKVYGMDGGVWDFDNSLEFLNSEFYAICGIPATLLGYGGSNKEISTRQLKVYFNKIAKHQRRSGTQLIENLFEPYLLAKGEDCNPKCIWPKKEIEERSERIIWAKQMYNDSSITLGEYRSVMNFNPIKPKETQVITVPMDILNKQMNSAFMNNGVADKGSMDATTVNKNKDNDDPSKVISNRDKGKE